MIRNCILRDLDEINDTTSPMDCIETMSLAKSVKWCINWLISECKDNPEGSAPILETVIKFKDGKLEFFTNDVYFEIHPEDLNLAKNNEQFDNGIRIEKR